MELKIATPAGTLIAKYKHDDVAPGFMIDLYRILLPHEDKSRYQGVCEISFNPDLGALVVRTYKEGERRTLGPDMQETVIQLFTDEEIRAREEKEALEEVQNKRWSKAVNIQWDTDGEDAEDLNLPTSVVLPDGMEDEEEISDYLSDLTGFCHKGFDLIP